MYCKHKRTENIKLYIKSLFYFWFFFLFYSLALSRKIKHEFLLCWMEIFDKN